MAPKGLLASIENAIGITISPSEKVADIENTVAIAIGSAVGQFAGVELAVAVAIVACELEAIVDAIVVAIAAASDIDIVIIFDAVEIMIAKHLDHDGCTHVIELRPDANGVVPGSTGQMPTVGAPAH